MLDINRLKGVGEGRTVAKLSKRVFRSKSVSEEYSFSKDIIERNMKRE